MLDKILRNLRAFATKNRRRVAQVSAQATYAKAAQPLPAAFYRRLVNNVSDVIWILGPDQTFDYVSPSVEQVRGFTPDEARQQSLAETFSAASCRVLQAGVRRIYEAERAGIPYAVSDRYELEQVCKDGSTVWIELIVTSLRDEVGTFAGILGVARDISQRKQAEMELIERKDQYHQMFAKHSAVELLIDPISGRIVEANPAASAFYGYPVDELQQLNIDALNILPFEQIRRKLELIRNRKRTYFQFQHRLASGEIRDVEVYSIPIRVQGKDMLHSIVHDITEQKRAEFNIQKANAELQQRVDELALLNSVAQTLTSTLDFDAILQIVTRELTVLFDADTCGIAMLTSPKTALRVVAEHCRTNTGSSLGLVLPLEDNPFSAQIIETGKTGILTAEDIRSLTSVPPQLLNQRRSYCLMIAPLISRGQVIGTIGIDTATPNRKFTTSEMALAETVAGQVAGVIANAQLFQQEQRQRQMAESLQEVVNVLNSSLDLQTVLKKILKQFGRVIEHDGAAVFLQDEDQLILTAGAKLADIFIGTHVPVSSENPGARVFKTNQGLLIADVNQDPGWEKWPHSPPIRSWMGAPLSVEGKVIGVLSSDSLRTNAYSEADLSVLQTFANHAATALRNAQQVQLIEDTLFEAQLLYRIGSILAKTPNTQQGVEKALGEFLWALKLEQGGLSLFDSDYQSATLYVLYRHGQPQPMGASMSIRSETNQQIIKTGRPLAIYDAYNDPLMIDSRELTIAHNIKSILLTPLISRGVVIGVMGADATKEHRRFTEHEKSLAQAIADSIATTLENARLLEQEQRQRQMAESLREVGTILNSSLDHQVVLKKILEHLGRVVKYEGAGILLQKDDQLVFSAGTNLADDFVGYTVPLASSNPSARVVKNKKPVCIPDVHQDPDWETWPGGSLIRGWMGVPLISSKGIIGTLTVDSTQVDVYGEEDARVLQTFANQAAIAIENANLVSELQEAKEAAEAASHAKDIFLASVSHELRTPLNGILGFAQILKMDATTTNEQREGLDIIEQSGKHLLTLINDILDLAKVEAGKLELHYSNFNLNDFLKGVCKIMGVRAEFKDIYFRFEPIRPNGATQADFDLPAVVYGDEIRLRQVLINLLGNAIKFTQIGGVTFRVGRVDSRSDPAARLIRFEIEDTGSGIPPEELELIFEPFHQVDEQTRKVEGTGLGLTICYKLVRLMGGNLQVKSILNQGSVFWFEIPLPEVVNLPFGLPANIRQIVGVRGQPPRILIVDQTPENRKVLLGLLSPLSREIIEAADGEEGLNKALQYRPHVIITDLQMPKLSGLEMTARIRQDAALKDVVVIASSSRVFDVDRARSLEAGCDAFIPKPVRADSLFSALQTYLNVEWIYADTPSEQAQRSRLESLIAPPPDQLAELVDLARIGDIRQLRVRVEQLEQHDERLKPFAQNVNTLLKGFHLEKLRTFLESFETN